MATTVFVASGLEFVPNNYSAPLNTVNAPEVFHIIQNFLAQSAIGRALVEPEKLSSSQIKAFWETGLYDDGGETGNPSIIFEYEDTEYVITAGTIRAAMGFPEFSSYTIGMGDEDLIRMMREIGYSGPLSKIGQLKRPFLRKEWSFFFDCITRTFSKKCTNWDAIPTDSLQIGYSLLFDNHFDFARLVLNNLGEKMTENRGVVYFSRFCQTLFSYCVEGVEVGEEDVSCFKLHKRIFSDLINKDVKKGVVGDLLLPQSVQQFLNAQVNPPPQASSQPEPLQQELPPSTSVKSKRGGRTKHVGTKPARVAKSNAEAGASKTDGMPQEKRLKKRRANRAQSDAAVEDSETDEETLHQRKRRLVAAHLFYAENISSKAVENLEVQIQEDEAVFKDIVSMENVTPEVQEENFDTTVPTKDRVNTATEAPTSNADDVVEEDADHSDSRIFEPQEFHMEVEANTSLNSEHFTEGLEADLDTVRIEESMASHTEILTFEVEKGEEVNQTLAANATETVAANPDVVEKDATENVPFEAEFVANSEDALVLEALQQSVVEIVQREAEYSNNAHSDDPEKVAENVITENEAEDDNAEASPTHSNPDIQVELSDIQANSDETREVNRATAENFQNMYFSNWSSKDTIFSNERAADFVTKSSKEIKNPKLLSHLKATIVQIKSLNNRFDASDKVIKSLRNDIATRELTQQKDKSLYISLCKDQKNFDSRLSKVEENQVKMSTKLDEIANSIELLTSVLLSDDVKKGERVSKDKCKSSQTLTQKDDTADGGARDKHHPRSKNVQRQGRRSNSDAQKMLMEKDIHWRAVFFKEHGKDVTIEDIQAEEQLLAEEHRKDVEAGIYKQKVIKAPRRKEKGIVIKENVNSDQSLQYSRRPICSNADKGKGVMIEEPNLNKKFKSTSDIAQVETRLAKSTSDAAQVDVITKVMTTSDVAQVVHKSTLLPGFSKPKILEDLKLEAVNFSETRTVLGKEAFDKSGLGSHRERRTNNRSQDNISLAESGIGVTQENLDKLESVQLIFHRVLKKQFLLYFMSDGRVYKVGESDVNLKSWEELEYVLYLLKVKNRHTHDVAQVLREKMLRSKAMLGGGVSSVYIPKYRDHAGKIVEMKRNSARFKTALGIKVLEFNLESDKAHYIRLGNDMKKNSIYSLRAAIYQTGEGDPEYKELKEIMIAELENAERRLLIDYLRTVPDVQEVK
ncbi:hypothetical protein POM88_043804 [Heracleum sosnowskyi]|uniref:Uncharacterized protein n=1 Tax=Heracleum sosnowskyi TaxID=360622 RepID=A0AAD8H1P1_9APIA|nr:hypothetical protein POM88_043804 [Heracleum sosnowskyi]